MRNLRIIIVIAAGIIVSIASAQSSRESEAIPFADMNGGVGAGIICDGSGNMFAARAGGVARIDPEGRVHPFCDLTKLPRGKDYYFTSPLVWSMAFDGEGNIIAAAQDRILRIRTDGTAETLVREDFGGFVGASGLALDGRGNIYVTDGSRILRYGPGMKKETFIDASTYRVAIPVGKSSVSYSIDTFLFLAFDPGFDNLYASDFNAKVLLKYPLDGKGRAGEPVVLLDPGRFMYSEAPLNVIFGEKGSIFVSIDLSSRLIRLDSGGAFESIKIPGYFENHCIAFGGKGFEEDCIYFTTYAGDKIHKVRVGEKAAVEMKERSK